MGQLHTNGVYCLSGAALVHLWCKIRGWRQIFGPHWNTLYCTSSVFTMTFRNVKLHHFMAPVSRMWRCALFSALYKSQIIIVGFCVFKKNLMKEDAGGCFFFFFLLFSYWLASFIDFALVSLLVQEILWSADVWPFATGTWCGCSVVCDGQAAQDVLFWKYPGCFVFSSQQSSVCNHSLYTPTHTRAIPSKVEL